MSTYSAWRFIESHAHTLPVVTVLYGEEVQLIEEVRQFFASRYDSASINRLYLETALKNNMSPDSGRGLFSGEQEYFEIIVNTKPDSHSDPNRKANGLSWLLTKIERTQTPDTLLIIIRDWEYQSKKQAWFKKLCENRTVVHAQKLAYADAITWIRYWGQDFNLEPDALQLLALHSEGNLTTAKQAVEKLKLTSAGKTINENLIREVLSGGAGYDCFDFMDAILDGKPKRALGILKNLLEAETPDALLLWSICQIILALEDNKRMWGTRLTAINRMIKASNKSTLPSLFSRLSSLDRAIKGVSAEHKESLFSSLVFDLASMRRLA